MPAMSRSDGGRNFRPGDITLDKLKNIARSVGDAVFLFTSVDKVWHRDHSSVANSTSSKDRHGPCGRITSVLNRPMMDSASALSYESPMLSTDGSMPASASRSVWRMSKPTAGWAGWL